VGCDVLDAVQESDMRVFASMLGFFLVHGAAVADMATQCPINYPTDRLLGPDYPASGNWFGSDELAVNLPNYGIWSVTKKDHLIAIKLFWRSAGFEPGMEKGLDVSVRNVNDPVHTAVVTPPTNAYAPDLGGWAMLVGIDFQGTGCWEITGTYEEQTLSFVVQTVEVDEYKRIVKELAGSSKASD
jgi:hypothetical protein